MFSQELVIILENCPLHPAMGEGVHFPQFSLERGTKGMTCPLPQGQSPEIQF